MPRNVAQLEPGTHGQIRDEETKQLNCEIPKFLVREVRKVATDRGISGKQLVAEILEQHICEHTAEYLGSLAAPAGGNR